MLFELDFQWGKALKNGPSKIYDNVKLLLAVFQKLYSVHFWILCPNLSFNQFLGPPAPEVFKYKDYEMTVFTVTTVSDINGAVR